jgi:hypothetical protein
LASRVRDALVSTFEMKKVPGHTPSIQFAGQSSGARYCLTLRCATTGPIPGIAIIPRPASKPATPPTVAPMSMTVPKVLQLGPATVTVVVMLARRRRGAFAGKPVVCIGGYDTDLAGRNTNRFQLVQNPGCGCVVIIKTR